MRNYEAIYILKPDMDEEAVVAAVTRFEDVVKNNGGEIVKLDRWGKRRLAYELNDYTEGHYVLMNFKSPSTAFQELERMMRISDFVLRQLIIKKED